MTNQCQITSRSYELRSTMSNVCILDRIHINDHAGSDIKTGDRKNSTPNYHQRVTRPTDGCPGWLKTVTTDNR